MPTYRARALLVGAMLLLTALGFNSPALAHHGWSSFNTRHAYFASGTVAYARWGDPHSEVRLRIDQTALPPGWEGRTLPQGADPDDGRSTMTSARPYAGERKELRLVLAGPGWMKRWGMDRPPRVGERIEVVGYLNSSEDRELRPVMFWLEDGQGVWQQLTSFPQRPEPAAPNRR